MADSESQPPGPVRPEAGSVNYSLLRLDVLGFLRWLVGEYGDLVRFDLGRTPHYLVANHAEARALLDRVDELHKPEFLLDSNRGHWGDGLTTLEGSAWRERRRQLRPQFTRAEVAARLPIVAECTADLLATWRPGEEIDLRCATRRLTARIAARTIFDAEVEDQGDPAGRAGVLPLTEALGEDYASTPSEDGAAPINLVRPRAPRCMDVTVGLIDARIASGEARGDVLSALVAAGLPRDAIVGELVQMLYAGHHTVPFSFCWFMRDLEAHPEVRRRMVDEAGELLAGVPDDRALARSYAMAALRESLRVHAPAPLLYREVAEPFELRGFALPRGAAVWICPELIHADARVFPEPDAFRPERFRERRVETTYGFGAGPRTCIGNTQARQQMALMASMVVERFRLRSVSGDVVRVESARS